MKNVGLINIIIIFFFNDLSSQEVKTLKNYDVSKITIDLIFDQLTENDGLSHNLVTDILQDREGMVWISTIHGLNRYDGKRFEIFQKKKNKTGSLPQNFITGICEDAKGNIWGSSEDGIFYFDKINCIFKEYRSDSINYPRCNYILCDRNDRIWAVDLFGLLQLDPHTGKYLRYKDTIDILHNISDRRISTNGLILDPFERGLWLATFKGLNFFDFKTKKFVSYLNQDSSEIFNSHHVSSLHVSSDSLVWFFDNQTKSIIGFKTESNEVIYKIHIGNMMKSPYGGTIIMTDDQYLWYSSESYEIIIIDYKNGNQFKQIRNHADMPGTIAGDYISCSWKDSDGTIWFGTAGGISLYNPSRTFYQMVRLPLMDSKLDKNWNITTMAQNPKDGKVWIGTREQMIYIYDPINKNLAELNLQAFYPKEKLPQFITDIELVDNKAIICFINAQTFQLDLKTYRLEKFSISNPKYANYKTRVIVQETDSTLILGNNYYPLLRWNLKNNTFQEINFKDKHDQYHHLNTAGWLAGSLNKAVWMAASNYSVGYLHPGDTQIYTIELPIGNVVKNGGFFNSMNVDQNGDAWFSFTSHGLFRVHKLKPKVSSIQDIQLSSWDSSDGLVTDILNAVSPDKGGRIWASSYNKFSVFDPITEEFSNFKIALSDNNLFYYNYVIQLSNGNVLASLKGNLVEFFPKKMKYTSPSCTPIIGAIQLPERRILISGEKTLILNADENFLTFEFGCVSVNSFYPFKQEYLLEGINHQWITDLNSGMATYTNLSPGSYMFKVRNTGSDKSWQSEISQLRVVIKTPYYKSWWFISLLSLSSLGLLVYLVRTRLIHLRNLEELKLKAQLLEKEKTTVMYENLKQQLNPHFLFNSLTSLSSLIRINQKQAGDFLDKMSKVYRYILKNKDQETVLLSEEIKFVDLYIQLQQTRLDDGLIIEKNISPEMLNRRIVPVTLQNLVENAIKHNIASKEDPLTIRLYTSGNNLIVENTLNRKSFVETSNKQGLKSMISLYEFLSEQGIKIEERAGLWVVKIPLI